MSPFWCDRSACRSSPFLREPRLVSYELCCGSACSLPLWRPQARSSKPVRHGGVPWGSSAGGRRLSGRFNARRRSRFYCQADRYCRTPRSAFVADARACWLHDGQSRIRRRRLTRRDGPRSVLPLRRPPHPSSSRPPVPVKSSRPPSRPRLKPRASRSISS